MANAASSPAAMAVNLVCGAIEGRTPSPHWTIDPVGVATGPPRLRTAPRNAHPSAKAFSFIGRFLCMRLLSKSHEVTGVYNRRGIRLLDFRPIEPAELRLGTSTGLCADRVTDAHLINIAVEIADVKRPEARPVIIWGDT